MWAYVLILIIGVAVTVLGLRIGRRRREDPFADVRSEGERTEPEAFTSLREPTPLAGADEAPGVGASRVPRATLEERLREARDARAAKQTETASETEGVPAPSVATPAAETSPASTLEAGTSAAVDPGQGTELEPVPRSAAAATTGSADADVEPAADPEGASSSARASSEPVAATEPASGDATPNDVPPSDARSPAEPILTRQAEPTPAPAPARMELRALDATTRDGFAQRWTPLRMRLLARPGSAIGDADAFVRELLAARGLPSDPDDPAMTGASNAYPDIVDPFRLATSVARHAADGVADPQQLRIATVHYRDAVERLLAEDASVG